MLSSRLFCPATRYGAFATSRPGSQAALGNTQAPARQAAYLRALRTLPNVTIHLGHFLTSEVSMPLVQAPATGPKTVKVIKTEEKGSDVNLATYLIIDAMRGDCDAAAVVSNDSDLCEPIRIVQQELQRPVGLLNPQV